MLDRSTDDQWEAQIADTDSLGSGKRRSMSVANTLAVLGNARCDLNGSAGVLPFAGVV